MVKKGSPKKVTVERAVSSKEKAKKGSPSKVAKARRTNRHQYDKITHQVFTPYFSGLEAHMAEQLSGKTASPAMVHDALMSYNAKSVFSANFEKRSKQNRTKTKRPLSTFMLFQREMRERVSAKLEKELGRKPSQPEVVKQLGLTWNALKEKPGGIEKYQAMYEESKRRMAAETA